MPADSPCMEPNPELSEQRSCVRAESRMPGELVPADIPRILLGRFWGGFQHRFQIFRGVRNAEQGSASRLLSCAVLAQDFAVHPTDARL